MASDAKRSGIKVVADNKKARFDFSIEESYEAGLELRGSEVKSLRAGDVNLKDSYIIFKNGEAFLQNAHISVYKSSSYLNHAPERLRRLLLGKHDILKLERAINERGYTCVPLKIYFKGSWAKIEVALAKGKKAQDKRESIKSRDVGREIQQAKRKSRI
jgi:SsrA-binding protein